MRELNESGDGSAPASPPEISLSGVRVLVVDDDADTRDLMHVLLTQCGAEVETAASVSEALERVEHWHPDLLVTDIGMPERDGFDMIREFRRTVPRRGREVPAIAVTAYASEADRSRTRSAGFQGHLAKPIDPGEFVQVVERTILGETSVRGEPDEG